MIGRDVQGLEVVPLVFDLRTVGHGESEPAHDLFQFLDRLRDRMEMAERRPRAGLRRIERRARRRRIGAGQSRLGFGERGFEKLLDFVESLAGRRFVGACDASQALLRRLQSSAFRAEKFDPRRFQCRLIRGAAERRAAGGG